MTHAVSAWLTRELPSKFPIRTLAVVYGVALLGLGLLVGYCVVEDVAIGFFTRDPGGMSGLPPTAGIVSNLGALFWSSAATLALFTALVLQRRKAATSVVLFFVCSGLLTLWLLFDDFFMFHDYMAHQYLHIDEAYILAVLGLVTLAYLIGFRRIILRSDFGPLLLALGFFALSILVDQVHPRFLRSWRHLFEDGPKLFGILSWWVYFAWLSYQTLLVERHWPVSGQVPPEKGPPFAKGGRD